MHGPGPLKNRSAPQWWDNCKHPSFHFPDALEVGMGTAPERGQCGRITTDTPEFI